MNDKMIDQLLHEIAQEGVSESLDLWPRIQEGLGGKKRIFGGRGMRRAATLTVGIRAAIGLLLILGLGLAVSPAVRAQFTKIRREVGGMLFFEVDKIENVDMWIVEEVESVPPPIMTVEEAKEAVGYDFKMPEWIPEGYVFSGEVQLWMIGTQPSIHMRWGKQGGELWEGITFTVEKAAILGFQVGKDGIEEVEINGKPAALVKGIWNGEGEWMSGSTLLLMWYDENWRYQVGTFNQEITVDILMKIAESIK